MKGKDGSKSGPKGGKGWKSSKGWKGGKGGKRQGGRDPSFDWTGSYSPAPVPKL